MSIHNQDFPTSTFPEECGFSCPSCGEYTETSPCKSCHAIISEDGQELYVDSVVKIDDGRVSQLLDETSQNTRKLVEKKTILVNGIEYEYYGEKTENRKLIFFLKIGGRDIKIISNPYVKNCILGIYKKGTSRTLYVSEQQFQIIRTIIGMFKRNPEKYGLSRLQIFKH